jgi:glycosyltransferase involved in cell wall biosynthesis
VRIGIFDPYLDDLGGGEKYMMTLAECLSKNHRVSVFWDNQKDLDELLKRFSINFSDIRLTKNIFASNFGFLKRLLESRKYDAIIFLSDGSIPFLISKKVFLHLQQPLKDIETKGIKNKIKLMRISSVFYNSEYTKSFNKDKFSKKSWVLYPPVNHYPNNQKKENIILHVGRFRIKNVSGVDDYKKQSLMVKVFKEMVDKGFKDWKLNMAVSIKDDDLNKFEEMKESAKGYPVKFIVNSSNDDLGEIYAKAKLYWHASGFGEDLKMHPEFAEHFGISTVEAMSAGVVPVVINAGGQKEIVINGENGFLWDSLEELKSKTLELTQNNKLLEKMSENASKSSDKFSKEKFCQAVNELISK